jgi:hypothetical protein
MVMPPSTCIRQEPDDGLGDVGGFARPACRLHIAALGRQHRGKLVGNLTRQAERGAKDRGGDQAGAHGIDPDVLHCQLGSGHFRELDHACLRGGIGQRPPPGLQPCNRGGVDDRPAAARRHQGHGMLGAKEHRRHQKIERGLEGTHIG